VKHDLFARERDMAPVVIAWMESQNLLVKREALLFGYCDLLGCELDWAMVKRRERRQKDWIPLHRRIIAVELKLSNVSAVLRQARENRYQVNESYVALPFDIAVKAAARQDADGIGVIGVRPDGCQVLRAAAARCGQANKIEHQVEKFWRERRALAEVAP
jgi:hypothetical protein